jgi:DNA-binding CsgD family transcriptional regulator
LGLTNREGEILAWVAQGKTNKEVAALLSLSPHSIRTRLEGIYHKLGVTTRTAAATKAFRILGLV